MLVTICARSVLSLHGTEANKREVSFTIRQMKLRPLALWWWFHCTDLPWEFFPDSSKMREEDWARQNPICFTDTCPLCKRKSERQYHVRLKAPPSPTPCEPCENEPTTRSDESVVDLKSMDYRTQYLASAHWRTTSKAVKTRDKDQCRRCGNKGKGAKLHVHHIHYDNTGCEPLKDLVTLCERCHEEIHLFPERHPEWIRPGTKPKPWGKRDASVCRPPEPEPTLNVEEAQEKLLDLLDAMSS